MWEKEKRRAVSWVRMVWEKLGEGRVGGFGSGRGFVVAIVECVVVCK